MKEAAKGSLRKAILISSFTLLVLIIDQALKFLLDRFVKNSGSVFGYIDTMIPSLIFAVIFLAIVPFFYSKIPDRPSVCISVGLLLGGIISNLLDRIFRGFVIDYIFPPHPLGEFNIADVGIWIGGVLIIIYLIRHRKEL